MVNVKVWTTCEKPTFNIAAIHVKRSTCECPSRVLDYKPLYKHIKLNFHVILTFIEDSIYSCNSLLAISFSVSLPVVLSYFS